MEMTVDIPENVVREAAARGIALERLVEERLLQTPLDYASLPGYVRFGVDERAPAKAAVAIRALRKTQTLGGFVTIQQLIDEGRP